jgi:hypothetical protein
MTKYCKKKKKKVYPHKTPILPLFFTTCAILLVPGISLGLKVCQDFMITLYFTLTQYGHAESDIFDRNTFLPC